MSSKKMLYLLVVLSAATVMNQYTPVHAAESQISSPVVQFEPADAADQLFQRSSWGRIKALYRGQNPLAQTDQTTNAVKKPQAEVYAISGEIGIRWPFDYSERPENWYGTDGNRTGGGTLSNPCGTGQMNSHSQADYYSRDLSRKSGMTMYMPVYAGRGGYVMLARNSGGYGYSVVIWDPIENIQLRYAHLWSINPFVGENMSIAHGALIGWVGNSGCGSCNPHLHLTAYKNIPKNSSGWPSFLGNLCRSQTYACSFHFY